MIRRLVGWMAIARLATAPAPAQGQQFDPARFERYLRAAMTAARVPGVSVVVVRGDSVLLAKGYGVRAVGRPEPVDTGTVFAIGSVTKSFTALALAMLVDEGRLAWDDRVTDRLAGFELADPYVTREVTVRDLLSHRVGLPRCDIWYGAAITRAEVIRRMRYCPQTAPFRTAFGYQNAMYLAAGQLIPALTGRTWDDFVASRILRPLGMGSTTTSVRDVGPGNVASPHAEIDGVLRPVPWRTLDNVAPAGALNSTAGDLGRWIRFLLHRGAAPVGRLVSENRLAELWSPTTLMPAAEFPEWRSAPFLAYGLGWVIWDRRGRLVVEHSGGIDGMSSDVALLPELGFGIAVLSNRTESGLPEGLVNWALDAASGKVPRDWAGELVAAQDAADAALRRTWSDRAATRAAGTAPSLPLEKYVGRYADSLAGPGEVHATGGRLTLVLPERRTELALDHWHYDAFVATWPEYRLFGPRSMVSFELGPDGLPAAVTVEGVGRFGAIR